MNDTFRVVRNDEGQYSLMPSDMLNPPGWRDEGTIGTRAACLARIGEVWTDLRPRSLRESVAARTA